MPLASLALSKIASYIKRTGELFIIETTHDCEGEKITHKYCRDQRFEQASLLWKCSSPGGLISHQHLGHVGIHYFLIYHMIPVSIVYEYSSRHGFLLPQN